MRRCIRALAFAQRDTPVLPLRSALYDGPVNIRVGYLLCRPQIVHHAPHPLETELSYVIEREHKSYARHDKDVVGHFADYACSIDNNNRQDSSAIAKSFFGQPAYDDAVRAVAGRWKPGKRVTPADFVDPFADAVQRHTLHRALADCLYLIIREKRTAKWTVPSVSRKSDEPLRATVQRALDTHHGAGGLLSYCFSNAPQAVLSSGENDRLFVFSTVYCRGRPTFKGIDPEIDEHAWVTPRELSDYEYVHDDALAVLQDITYSPSLVTGDAPFPTPKS